MIWFSDQHISAGDMYVCLDNVTVCVGEAEETLNNKAFFTFEGSFL